MMFRICSFYTFDTIYKKEAQGLIETISQFKYDYHIKGYHTRGSWVQNVGIKPEYIYEMMELYPDQDIVFIDADARIRQPLMLFKAFQGDIGVHYLKGELLSGTIYLKNNERVRAIIRIWIKWMSKHSGSWDQKVFDLVLKKHARLYKIKIEELPSSYTKIFDKMEGDAVIEHFQASRRFKQNKVDDCPKNVLGIRIRVSEDGSIWISRKHRKAEAWLDSKYIRKGKSLRWVKKTLSNKNVMLLKDEHEGKGCYVVGKGPSLDKVEGLTNQDWPIICINESIHKIEKLGLPNPIYCLQQDTWLQETCRPRKAVLITTDACKYHYRYYEPRYVFSPLQFGYRCTTLSAILAIKIAEVMGCVSVVMVSFDACVDGTLGYAKCVGYAATKGGKERRFLGHRRMITSQACVLPLRWGEFSGNSK